MPLGLFYKSMPITALLKIMCQVGPETGDFLNRIPTFKVKLNR